MNWKLIASCVALCVLAALLGGCQGLVNGSSSTTSTQPQQINHIIFMVQENRSFDHYFGSLRAYWAANGYPDRAFDGLPQFNPASGPPPLQGPAPTNPGCDPSFPFDPPGSTPSCTFDSSSPLVTSFHIVSQCTENPSPSWNESHADWNLTNPVSSTAALNGLVNTAADDARRDVPPLHDTDGIRAMSYYNGDDLPYYYFMASNFATSDRWFSPIMSRTQPNRMYLMAATSAGHAYPLPAGSPQMNNKTIFEDLNDANVSWRVYVTDSQDDPIWSGTELNGFAFAAQHTSNFVPATQFLKDLQNNNLPSVSEIDPGFESGLDEHSGEDPSVPSGSIQVGAAYVASLINAFMQSPYWKDSVFILTWDEFGGFYDHVPPQPMPSPDGIAPVDLLPGDICTKETGPTCNFGYTGYRVPLIVISPFAKKNYVSHTVADYTAILKFIETRFNLPSLTQRDAAQMDMSEFFDLSNPPWETPPSPPSQPTNLPCEYTTLQ